MSDQSTPQSNTNPASPGDSLSLDATSPFLECNVESDISAPSENVDTDISAPSENVDNDISAPPENAPLLSWASQVSLASKDEQISNSQTYQSTSTYQLSDHDSSDMDTQTCIFVCPSKVKKFVSASNSSAAPSAAPSAASTSTSKHSDQMGPPLGVPLVLNGLCFSLSRNTLYRVKDFYKNGDVRLQNPAAPRDRPLKPPSDLIGLPSSLDNTQEMRTLKEENYRLRRSRDAHERELYTTNEELSRAKTRISQLNDSLDNNRTANRILSGEVAELEKKLREKSKRVGKSKDSASQCSLIQSCSSTCRHLRDLKKEVRSIRTDLEKDRKKSRSSRARSSSSSSDSSDTTR